MKKLKLQHAYLPLALLLTLFVAGCSSGSSSDSTPVPTATPDSTDTTAPTVTLTAPAADTTGVATNTKIGATFSEAMDPLTITDLTFNLKAGTAVVTGSVAYLEKNAVFTPESALATDTLYTATITTGAKDSAGNQLDAAKEWNFTTAINTDTEDITAPEVVTVDPADGIGNVILSKKVQATFSEAMNPLTITSAIFTLTDSDEVTVPGTVSYVGLVATFTPTSSLTANINYKATITEAAQDMAGNPLAAEIWTFTTVTAEAEGPLPVDLGTSEDFVLLTKTGITTTGTTSITGNIGASPIGASGITGFGLTLDALGTPPGQFATSSLVTGKVYAADYAVPTPAKMTTAISDMETAYADAAGRSLPDFTELGAGNISGMTLVPGLYKWGTGVLIDLNGVTLEGGANDVWIFQIADNLTVNNGAIVTLAGEAQAKNVFWQVGGGTGVSLGTTVQFKGIILATKAITFDTGAKLNGRALAQTNVTLNANAITVP